MHDAPAPQGPAGPRKRPASEPTRAPPDVLDEVRAISKATRRPIPECWELWRRQLQVTRTSYDVLRDEVVEALDRVHAPKGLRRLFGVTIAAARLATTPALEADLEAHLAAWISRRQEGR